VELCTATNKHSLWTREGNCSYEVGLNVKVEEREADDGALLRTVQIF
jgi:hypothetical protein